MGEKYFTNEEVEQFKTNINVVSLSAKSITYHENFKQVFIEKYNNGESPTKIFIEAGFNPCVLGSKRITTFTTRIKDYANRLEGLRDTREDNVGRPKVRVLSKDEELKLLKHKNDILKQENDFLKRIQYINKKNLSKQ